MQALKEYSPDEAKVIRDGLTQPINATDLVPGDIISLSAGDKIPADARVISIQSASFRADQSILTGESVSVLKSAEEIVQDLKAVRQDQINMLFAGTTVTVGKCTAVVTATGTDTAIGDIHTSISSQISEPTPLKKRLDEFGDQLAKIISVVCVLVWIINIRHFADEEHFGGNWLKGAIYYFKIAVALAVAAIPEGLAVVITTCLALGTSRMAAQGAIVRKLRSVETLGCTSVICTDKTGTVTTNQMSVRRVLTVDPFTSSLDELYVSGSSYAPVGEVTKNDGTSLPQNVLCENAVLDELAQICALCNDSKVVYHPEHGTFAAVGEPTEAALRVLVEKLGTDDPVFNQGLKGIEELEEGEKQGRMMACNEFLEGRFRRVGFLNERGKGGRGLVERAREWC